jgi:hypothetical protein
MALNLKAKTITRTGDGSDIYTKAMLTGEIGIADYFAIKAFKGQMFNASSVSVTTATTWTATATIDITKPALWLNVPTGKAIIPVFAMLYMEAFGSNAQFECQGVIGTGGSYTSGMTAITPVCTRSDISGGSACTVYAGGNSTVVVGQTANLNYFWRDGQQFAITKTTASATASVSDPNRFVWRAKDEYNINIAGPNSQLQINQGSQAGTGFVTLVYVEIPATDLP